MTLSRHIRKYYRDEVTGKRRYCEGDFVGWVMGIGSRPEIPQAVFRKPYKDRYVPLHLIEAETLTRLPPPPTVTDYAEEHERSLLDEREYDKGRGAPRYTKKKKRRKSVQKSP